MKYKRSLLVVAAALVGVLLAVQMFAAFNTAEAGPIAAPVSVEPAAAVDVAAWEPITFDSNAVTYTLTGFGGADDSTVVVDPTNAANNVAKVVKSATAATWAGTTVSTGPNFSVPALPFTASDTTMTVRVWSPNAGIQIRLKVEDAADPTKSVETEATTTVASDWETLTFNFANQAGGTAALNLAYTYNKVSIFFNFGVDGATAGEKTYYFDDVAFGGGTTPPPSTWDPITFDSNAVTYTLTGFGGADDSTVVVDPTNAANYVAKVVKSAAAETWAGTTVSTEPNNSVPKLPFTASDTKMTVRVWSPDAGIQVRLKVEDAADGSKSVETEATTTVANDWETLTFDFSNQVAGTAPLNLAYTYSKISIFFNFGVTGATAGEKIYYFDDVAFGGGTTPPPPAWESITFDSNAVTYTLTGFGGADDSTVVVDPTNAANKVAKVVKSATAATWAGTTVSTEPNNSVPKLPFTASDTKMTVRVWSPDAGIQVRVKVEDAADVTKSVETEATTTVANNWQTLTFDFANQAAGTAELNLAYTYSKVSIFFNFGVDGATAGAKTYYFDDVAFGGGTTPPPPLSVGFSPNSYTVTEGETASISVKLNATSTNTVTVDYASSNGTATAGADYTATAGSLVFAPGDLVKSFTVATTDDAEEEPTETVNLTLSNPISVALGSARTAVLNIRDNDTPPAVGGGHSVIVDNYEYTNGLPAGVDADGVPVGYVTWSYNNSSSAITLTVPAEQRPGAPANNQVMQLDLNLGAGNWGGFSHNFENATLDEWVSQDWSSYVGVSFWLYGNNTGGIIFLDIMDNRNPGATTDDAERWSKDIPDDFDGWKYIEIPFDQFNRKDIGNGAPNDGFGKTAVHGYGIGGFGSAPMLNQTYYIDNLGLIPRTTVVDDYEYTNGLPTGVDADGVPVGYVTWSYNNSSSAITLTVPAEQRPSAPAGNQVMQLDLNLGAGNWGGFSHNFENAALDEWVSQDWSTYEGVCFWLYGNNTGGIIFLDIMDNRNPGATTDDAERWSVDIPDDFTGWKFIQIPFSQFNRKDIGNGAPNDGFNKTAVHGYGIGGFGSAPMLNQTYYIDDMTIYGNVGGTPQALELAFTAAKYSVTEGATAVMTVGLNMTSTTPVTVIYRSMEGQATPDVDYTPVSGTLVFAPGDQYKTIEVVTLDDAKHESDESVMVNLYDVDGAAFAFQRRAMLTIVDNDPADPNELDDFEGYHSFVGVGDVSLSITELGAGDPNALPGQGALEHVLTVQYNDAAPTTNRIYKTFTMPQDWSGADGLSFWYFGSNTGKTINVEVWDNQITDTNSMIANDWVLRWADEFNEAAGTPPNPNNWKHEIGDGALNGIPGWGNSEFEYYTDDPANASTDGNGNLVISLKAVDTANSDLLCYYGPCRYTSARLLTADRAEFLYGKIEARLKLPPTDKSGIWPAFWALGTNINEPGVGWPQSGEIDIMEYVSRIPNEIFGTLHGPGYSGGVSYGKTVNVPNLLADYHTYTIEWWENHIIWYVDGVKFHEARNTDAFLSGKEWVYNHPFFLLLNVAIGGNFGGTVSDQMTFPQNTLVDYVRVYQAPLQAELFEAGFVDNFTGWQKVVVPFNRFVRSADQPAGAPNDGLTLTSVNGYGFRFPSGSTGVAAQAQIVAHIDQVKLITFTYQQWLLGIFKSYSHQPGK